MKTVKSKLGKDEGRPTRPLNAYNIFFAIERRKIVAKQQKEAVQNLYCADTAAAAAAKMRSAAARTAISAKRWGQEGSASNMPPTAPMLPMPMLPGPMPASGMAPGAAGNAVVTWAAAECVGESVDRALGPLASSAATSAGCAGWSVPNSSLPWRGAAEVASEAAFTLQVSSTQAPFAMPSFLHAADRGVTACNSTSLSRTAECQARCRMGPALALHSCLCLPAPAL